MLVPAREVRREPAVLWLPELEVAGGWVKTVTMLRGGGDRGDGDEDGVWAWAWAWACWDCDDVKVEPRATERSRLLLLLRWGGSGQYMVQMNGSLLQL